ncbi:hypothetical protein MBM_08739 [Drepanopeziza brunnea f. sp. 'multigermtubi' MB_m1]|uniref:Cep57 centrosome microtubule-binding domain-containing protein n=1 Tax=Marssonina brunnea f. sp. multigermtubi (strain MB_m1) TaxID=1072389 RepID=K1WK94_MARBU|nr:uncharacterized protein MBM_08739 [Drepanopeziza brunnea f. sp. 'multigermtubi' MB_m1]EKD13296.1 hypothetical protein MBM_08739 [Drepanopeziza brunnea f. sp. 'multigermtubi' MB_m1]
MPRSFSVASSTGSRHGTITDSSFFDFDPVRDGADQSSGIFDHLNNTTGRAPSIPIRDTAKKAGRWSPTPPRDITLNASRVGRAFPGFTSGNFDDSMSIEKPRAYSRFPPLPKLRNFSIKTTDGNQSVLDDRPIVSISTSPGKSATITVRPTSPIIAALQNFAADTPSDIEAQFKAVTERYAGKFAQDTRFPSAGDATKDSIQDATKQDTSFSRDIRFAPAEDATQGSTQDVTKQTTSFSKRPQDFKPKNTRFAKPNISSPMKPYTQQGQVHTRAALQRHGPVARFSTPQEEEDILAMVESLKAQVLDLEAKVEEYRQARDKVVADREMGMRSSLATILGLQSDCDHKCRYIEELESRNSELITQKSVWQARLQKLEEDLNAERDARLLGDAQNAQPVPTNKELARTRELVTITKHAKIKEQRSQRSRDDQKARADDERARDDQRARDDHQAREDQRARDDQRVRDDHKAREDQRAREVQRSRDDQRARDVSLARNIPRPTSRGTRAPDATTASKSNRSSRDVQKLVPVSKRVTDPDATMRPSLEPVRALADVVRGEEKQLRRLKAKRAELQAQYDAHDPSYGMRKRQSMKKALDDLTIEIEHLCNKIYRLYDVVEVVHDDDTTQGLVSGGDDTEDLPWDGIEEE